MLFVFYKRNEIVIRVATLCAAPCIYVYAEGCIVGPATSVCNISSFYKLHVKSHFWIYPYRYAGYLHRVSSLKVKSKIVDGPDVNLVLDFFVFSVMIFFRCFSIS